MSCTNCGKMNSEVEGKAPLEYFREHNPAYLCNCSDDQLQAARDAAFYSDKIRWFDAQAVRGCNARTPGGIAAYEADCDSAEMYRQKFDEAWALAKGR